MKAEKKKLIKKTEYPIFKNALYLKKRQEIFCYVQLHDLFFSFSDISVKRMLYNKNGMV